MATRRWTTPRARTTRRSSSSWRTPPPSQRRSAAPRPLTHIRRCSERATPTLHGPNPGCRASTRPCTLP
eukprot:scaffold84848_cov71-Phaeocystis_antarctica.AAC.4